MTYRIWDNHPAFPTQLPGTSDNNRAWPVRPTPSLEELRERNDDSRDDVHRDHVPPSAHEGPSRYPVSFAQANLAGISAILL